MSVVHELQQRLEEESSVMQAAEGLSPEARMLTAFAEKKEELDALTKEVKDLRDTLLAHYEETGELASNGPQILKVTTVETYVYDDDRIKEERPELFLMLAEVKAGKVTNLVKGGAIKAKDIDQYRTKKTAYQVSVEAAK